MNKHIAMHSVDQIEARFRERKARIGIVGMGYVGLPLALAACGAGFRDVIGFDIDKDKVDMINAGKSYFKHIGDQTVDHAVRRQHLIATTKIDVITALDAVIICVPTPLTAHREPDLTFVQWTTETIAPHLQKGQLIVLESTTWPGTTAQIMKPILERGGMRSGTDFYLAFSPEREDPGNQNYSTRTIPKVVGADDDGARRLVAALYNSIVDHVVTVSSAQTAEAVKLTENIFRAVNIALVNELKQIYDVMGIDVWEVIDAAKTKPFGYTAFYPGPGLGGHCIPIDPFYLTWKAREYGLSTKFIELAGEINRYMPYYVIEKLVTALTRSLRGARILIMGVAYKKNVDDMRESPALKLIELLEAKGAEVEFYDPLVSVIPKSREHKQLAGRRSIEWAGERFDAYDAVLIVTDHDHIDYAEICRHAKLVVDTRNICARRGCTMDNVIKA